MHLENKPAQEQLEEHNKESKILIQPPNKEWNEKIDITHMLLWKTIKPLLAAD